MSNFSFFAAKELRSARTGNSLGKPASVDIATISTERDVVSVAGNLLEILGFKMETRNQTFKENGVEVTKPKIGVVSTENVKIALVPASQDGSKMGIISGSPEDFEKAGITGYSVNFSKTFSPTVQIAGLVDDGILPNGLNIHYAKVMVGAEKINGVTFTAIGLSQTGTSTPVKRSTNKPQSLAEVETYELESVAPQQTW